jgi:adenosylcobinamide-GDP ribazoletransferase
MSLKWRPLQTAPRFMPLLGMAIGAVGGLVFWLGAQIWPASIAVVLSMLVTALLSADSGADGRAANVNVLGLVFALLVKYNALMALSTANLPFALPANLALGLIMIAGHAASRALVVSVLATANPTGSNTASHTDLGIALAAGFVPAVLIGLPGLIGLAVAIIARIVFIASLRRRHLSIAAAELDMTQQLTEVCFYLGALAAWAYI